MSGKYEKLKVSELKAQLKASGMILSGEKGTLMWRLSTRDKCEAANLRTWDGEEPCKLSVAKLRKACAKEGVSCIGSQDEMLELLVPALLKKAPSSSSTGGDSSGATGDGGGAGAGGKADGTAVAQRVLELDEADDFAGILNISLKPGDSPLSRSSPAAAMKKAYLKLSLLIHPDKLRSFDRAAQAFQALVRRESACCVSAPLSPPPSLTLFTHYAHL